MNFFCDANISLHLAHALQHLSKPEGHHVEHLGDRFPLDVSDTEWVTTLAREGRWAVITHDRAMSRRPLEQEALRRSGLIVFMLARAWNSQTQWSQAAALVRWWPKLIEQATLVAGGAAFEVPFGFSGKKRLRQIRL